MTEVAFSSLHYFKLSGVVAIHCHRNKCSQGHQCSAVTFLLTALSLKGVSSFPDGTGYWPFKGARQRDTHTHSGFSFLRTTCAARHTHAIGLVLRTKHVLQDRDTHTVGLVLRTTCAKCSDFESRSYTHDDN